MEIQSLFSLDIFIQGFFVLTCALLGLFILFQDNLETFKNIDSLHNFSEHLGNIIHHGLSTLARKSEKQMAPSAAAYLSVVPIVLALTVLTGIMAYSFADKWIDSSNGKHLGLKPLIHPELVEGGNVISGVQVKDLLRRGVIEYVFHIKTSEFSSRHVNAFYFEAKHELLQDEKFYGYLRKSQLMAEYNRVFALGFFILFMACLINLIIMILRVSFDAVKISKENPTTRLISISNGVILIFAIISFLATAFFTGVFDSKMDNPPLSAALLTLVFFGSISLLLFVIPAFRALRFSFFVYSLIYVVSVIGYISSSKTWAHAEKEVARKAFGVYKSKHMPQGLKDLKLTDENPIIEKIQKQAAQL